jgi:periplasmic protein TonB
MAYADNQGMSTNRIIAIVLVALLHAFIAFALVSGLAYEAVNKVKEKMEVVDVKPEEKQEEEPPPPPPEDPPPVAPPPVFAPKTNIKTNNETQRTTDDKGKKDNAPKYIKCPLTGQMILEGQDCVANDPDVACPMAPGGKIKQSQYSAAKCIKPDNPKCGPDSLDAGKEVNSLSECRPKPKGKPTPATPKGNPGSWANTNDYPSAALSKEQEGTTGFSVTIGPDGRVISCSITSSSGHASLDSTTCAKVKSRARFNPAKDADGNPTTGSYSSRVRWQIPKE